MPFIDFTFIINAWDSADVRSGWICVITTTVDILAPVLLCFAENPGGESSVVSLLGEDIVSSLEVRTHERLQFARRPKFGLKDEALMLTDRSGQIQHRAALSSVVGLNEKQTVFRTKKLEARGFQGNFHQQKPHWCFPSLYGRQKVANFEYFSVLQGARDPITISELLNLTMHVLIKRTTLSGESTFRQGL